MPWFTYLARCGDGTLYTGITTDPARREASHNGGRGAVYTRARLPVRIVYHEPAADRGGALRRERAIKRLSRGQKELLIGRGTGKESREFGGFGPGALGFLRRLARNNRRDWFERHRSVYQHEIREPLRALVEEMDVRLARLAPELVGDPRRSIFRIHRDVRFTADKSPYKTNAACQFYHCDAGRGAGQSATDAGAGLYFQLADGDCFVAGGIWMPGRPTLDRIRERLAEQPEAMDRVVGSPAFRKRFGRLDQEEMLTRLPRGYEAHHPAARWLRYRSFTASRQLTDKEVLGPRLPAVLERHFEVLVPLVRWLNHAIGYRALERRM